jgi:hypothetical protein
MLSLLSGCSIVDDFRLREASDLLARLDLSRQCTLVGLQLHGFQYPQIGRDAVSSGKGDDISRDELVGEDARCGTIPYQLAVVRNQLIQRF